MHEWLCWHFMRFLLDSGSFEWLCTDVSRRFMALLRSFRRVVSSTSYLMGPKAHDNENQGRLSLDFLWAWKLETPRKTINSATNQTGVFPVPATTSTSCHGVACYSLWPAGVYSWGWGWSQGGFIRFNRLLGVSILISFLGEQKEMVFNNLCDKTICLFNSALKMLKEDLMVTQSPPAISF